jgi:hypothetical protein
MNKSAFRRRILVLSFCVFTAASGQRLQAAYNLHAEGQATIFFGPQQFFNFDQTDGVKFYTTMIEADNPGNHAESIAEVQFGLHKGRIVSSGNFANSFLDIRTTDLITVHNPTGDPVHVRVGLAVDGDIMFSATPSIASVQASLSVNGQQRVTFIDQYIGASHTQQFPEAFEMDVPAEGSFNLLQRLRMQANPNGNMSIVIDFLNTSRAFIQITTAGASFTSSSGATYGNDVSIPEPASMALTIAAFSLAILRRTR